MLAARPSRQDVLERQLLLIGARPGVQVTDTALDEIGLATGHFRLIVHVKTWQAYAASGIDNLGSSSVGPWQSYATAAFHSYLTAGDAAVVNLSTTPADRRQLGFARMAYDVPVGSDGISVGATALYSDVRPGDWRSEFNDVTKTRSFEFRGRVNPIQSQNLSMFLTTALTFTDVSEKDVFGDIYRDRLRILSLTSDYRFKDLFDANSYLTLSLRQGLGGLGASQYGDAFLSRANASGEFSIVNLWFTRYQPLAEAWSLKISSAVQYASAELLTSQQFYVGGASFGRGYGSAEFGGDNAVAGSIELRFDHSFDWPVIKAVQVYGFADHGAVWNVGYGYGDGLSLASAGGGLRIFFDKDIRADIGVGMPLTYRSPDNFSRSPRFLFSLSNALQFCPPRMERCP